MLQRWVSLDFWLNLKVLFCSFSPSVSRLPDLGIPVLNVSYIRASLDSGRLLAVQPFRLTTRAPFKDKTQIVQPAEKNMGDETRNLDDASGAADPLGPPSPKSLQVQDTSLSKAQMTRRESVLSPQRGNVNRVSNLTAFQRKKPFLCRGSCPELTCEHRSDLQVYTSTKKNDKPHFQDLTGFSPGVRKSAFASASVQVKVEENVDKKEGRVIPMKKPLGVRLANMRSQITSLKPPVVPVPRIKAESPPAHGAIFSKSPVVPGQIKHSSTRVKIETQSPYATLIHPNKTETNTSLDQAIIQAYRKKYAAPALVAQKNYITAVAKPSQSSENLSDSGISPAISGIFRNLQEEVVESASVYQTTPISLK